MMADSLETKNIMSGSPSENESWYYRDQGKIVINTKYFLLIIL